jgi:hypothetical protein
MMLEDDGKIWTKEEYCYRNRGELNKGNLWGFYFSRNIIEVFQSWRIRYAEHVTHIGRTIMRAWYWLIDPEEINHTKVVQIGE